MGINFGMRFASIYLIDIYLSYYGELAIKSNFQPLPLCVVAPLPRNLNEGKGKTVRVCTVP